MGSMKIPLSFKEKEKDMYEFLKKQLSPCIFVKQLLKTEMEKQQPAKEPIKRDMFNF